MPSGFWGLIALLAAGSLAAIIAVIVAFLRDGKRRFQVFANRAHLWVADDVITTAVMRRLRHNSIGNAVGVLIGIVVTAVWLLISRPDDVNTFVWATALPVLLIATITIPMVLAVTDQLYRAGPAESRVARVSPLTVRDYVSPVRFWLVPVIAAIAVVLLIVGCVAAAAGIIDARAYFRSPALITVAGAMVLALAGALVARILVGSQQPAADRLELAWSDALRAETIRSLWVFEATVVWLALVQAGLGILAALDPPVASSWTTIILLLSMDAGIIGLGQLFTRGGAHSYYRYRLWPSLGDVGEIVEGADAQAERRS